MFFCPLFSGSSGNSTFIASDKGAILVDAGMSAKRIQEGLADVGANFSDINGILITHEHIDHIRGIGVIARRHNVPIYANTDTWNSILRSRKVGDIPKELRIHFQNNSNFFISDINVSPYETPHDSVSSVGFSVECDGIRAVTATDMGYIPKQALNVMMGADIVLLEFNYNEHMLENGSYPYALRQRIKSNKGHLRNEVAANALIEIANSGTNKFYLSHISKENNSPQKAYDAACRALYQIGKRPNANLEVEVAPPDRIGKAFIL